MSKEMCGTMNNKKLDGTFKRKLRRVDELLLLMLTLRLGLLLKDPESLFKMSSSDVKKNSFLDIFYVDLQGHRNRALNLSPTSVELEKIFQKLIHLNYMATLTMP